MPQRNAYIAELRKYDDPKNPTISPYDVVLPPTTSDAVIVPSDGKSVTEHLANKADNGEVGTWTPRLYGSTTAGTPTYAAQIGDYYKIDKMVYLHFSVVISNKGGMAGGVFIGGLPFTPKWSPSEAFNNFNNANLPAGWIFNGFTYTQGALRLNRVNNKDNAPVDSTEIADNFAIYHACLTYII